MDTLNDYCKKIRESPLTVCVWGLIVLVLLFLIYMAVTKQGFLNEFRSAPIATQRSSDLLGVGGPLRFTSEFGSTNQGGSHIVGESMAASIARGTEHMIGGYEAPVFNDASAMLEDYQRGNSGHQSDEDYKFKKNENFVGRNMFSEAFNVDEKLKNILHNN